MRHWARHKHRSSAKELRQLMEQGFAWLGRARGCAQPCWCLPGGWGGLLSRVVVCEQAEFGQEGWGQPVAQDPGVSSLAPAPLRSPIPLHCRPQRVRLRGRQAASQRSDRSVGLVPLGLFGDR